MATDDEQWWEAQAGEYALGTLRGTERDVFEKIMSSDTGVRERVQWWQEQLSALDARIPEVEPPEHVLPMIMSRIGDESIWEQTVDAELREITDSSRTAPTENVVPHRASRPARGLRLWQSVAGLSMAAAVALAVVLFQVVSRQAPVSPLPSDRQIVSILQSDADQQNLWLLSTDESDGRIRIQALAPPPIEADRAYELWVARPDDAGVASVGLLPATAGQVSYLTLPISADDAQLFAVSIEPSGGSLEPGPSGPVLGHGTIHSVALTEL